MANRKVLQNSVTLMYNLEKIIIRYIGQNVSNDSESDVTLDELEDFHKLQYTDLVKALKKLVKSGMVTETKSTLRKFRYLQLTDDGLQSFKTDTERHKPCKKQKRSKKKSILFA